MKKILLSICVIIGINNEVCAQQVIHANSLKKLQTYSVDWESKNPDDVIHLEGYCLFIQLYIEKTDPAGHLRSGVLFFGVPRKEIVPGKVYSFHTYIMDISSDGKMPTPAAGKLSIQLTNPNYCFN